MPVGEADDRAVGGPRRALHAGLLAPKPRSANRFAGSGSDHRSAPHSRRRMFSMR